MGFDFDNAFADDADQIAAERAEHFNRVRNSNRNITIDGETRLLVEWSEIYGTSVPLILDREKRGWDIERAITKPARKYRAS